MLTETEAKAQIQLKDDLVELIETQKLSSIQMIALKLGFAEDDVRSRLADLIDEGAIDGTLTEDGTRFFLSSVRISDAPIIRSNAESVVLEQPDTKIGKYGAIAGLASIIAGFVMRGLSGLAESLANMGAAAILLGIMLLAGGWLYISRKQVSLT
ncbi:MAG: hypothetical protein P1Q69_14725 [Candidatus Thorarchaeota archaeon]|nr:hypothetical protein [Candidatus Thorarchaeota archaeon]